MPTEDKLFAAIEGFHGQREWGHVLDAGTGAHSRSWLSSLPTQSLTLVTGAPGRATRLEPGMRPQDRVVYGNWRDPSLLHGQRYDVVLADYLLGAIDGFAPYFQGELLARLRPHVGSVLYFVGMQPLPDHAPSEAATAILDICRLRDACILLARHRCYREYPREWVLRSLERSGYKVLESWTQGIVYGPSFIDRQLDVAKRKLRFFADPGLAQAMGAQIEALRSRAKVLAEAEGGVRLGHDYVVVAESLNAPS